MGEDQKNNSRNERALRRAAIVERWWCGNLNKEAKKF
jgi:hypothetical protein